MTRRGNGEGSKPVERKNTDGDVIGYVAALRTQDGKRKYVYGKTQKEVRTKLAEVRRAHEDGRLVVGKAQKVGDYLDAWLEAKRRRVRPTTVDAYRLSVERLRPHIGHLKLSTLRPEHIETAYTELLKGLGPRSVEQTHAVLKTALRAAVKRGLLGANPLEHVTPPRPPRAEMKVLTPEQVETLLQSTQGTDRHPLWAVLVTTGMRIGEATALRWEDIDWDAGTLAIRRTVHNVVGQGLQFGEPKTERSRRRIELAPGAVAALRLQQDLQEWARRIAGAKWEEHGLVFPNTIGKPMDPGTVSDDLRAALKAAGLPRIRTHDLRHTAATYLLSQGVHPKVVQELLGHSTVTLTLNTYSHVLPSLHKEVASHMDRLFPDRRDVS